MRAAARELVGYGFIAWTVGDLLNWFERRDAGEMAVDRIAQTG
jgi:hypothetical protein